MGIKIGNLNIGKIYNGIKGISKVYIGNTAIYEESSASETIMTVNTAATYTLNLYKEDTKSTKIYVDDVLYKTSTTKGSQDISVVITENGNANHTIKIKNEGNWYFDNYCLGSSNLNRKLLAIDFTAECNMTIIGDYAFQYCTGLTSITIGNSITSIGNYAFDNCYGLTSVTIGDNVTSIQKRAFNSCNGLTSIIIPDNVTSIKEGAFQNCRGLTSLIIGKGVTSIGYFVFTYCSNLTSIVVQSGNTVYHSADNCLIETSIKTLIVGCKNSVIPSDGSVTRIETCAFQDCTGLTSIIIPSTIISIGSYAFEGCSGLISIEVESGNTVYHSADNCLIETATNTLVVGCKNSVIPSDGSVTIIGQFAFYKCTGLTSITIPNSVTSIEEWAFNGCTGLTNITIPNSVESIGSYAFSMCWLTSVTMGNGVTNIGDGAFSYCSGLTNITIPSSVTNIGSSAFDSCSGLRSITIPNSVTSIGEGAFKGCHGLYNIVIPNSITSINNYVFAGCYGLTSIVIPSTITRIGNYAFESCSGLKSSVIPNSVTTIGNYAFYGCRGLARITIPNNVTSIGSSALQIGSSSNKATITMLRSTPPTIRSDTFSTSILDKILVPQGTLSAYKSAQYWRNFASYIEDELSEICFTANSAGSTIELLKVGSPSISDTAYSYDRITWTTFTPSTTAGTNKITLANVGDKVYFRNNITADFSSSNYMKFTMSGSISASGNCNSLYSATDYNSLTTLSYSYCFYRLFYTCSALKFAPKLPITTFSARYCYKDMFSSCRYLISAPDLPAMALQDGEYSGMFSDCTSLEIPPALPATTLANSCYSQMFSGCSSLNTVPNFCATSLYQSCYSNMFSNCKLLYISDSSGAGYTNALRIPASGTFTNSSTYNQSYMFTNCLGTRSSDAMSGVSGTYHTYYTQNAPR